MKRVIFYIGGFIMLSFILASCVSKKKFEELARAKRMSDREIANLQNEKQAMANELQQLKTDFNNIRYQLTLNNATKDKQIDDLSSKLRTLEDQESVLRNELQDAQEQAKNKVQSKESELSSLQEQVKNAMAERDQLRKELSEYKTNAEWDNRKLKNEVETIKSNIQFKDSEITRLEKEIASVKKQLTTARKEMTQKEQEIEKLTNQVNLLKNELKKSAK